MINRHARENRIVTCRVVSPVCKKVRELLREEFMEKMDGESGDERDDELVCMR